MAIADRIDLRDIANEIRPGYAALRRAAEMFADHQDRRMKISNQIGSLTVGFDYGWYLESCEADEKRLSKELVRIYRDVVPLGAQEWARETRGIGASDNPHMLARLLGHLGHPRLAVPKHWARNETIGDSEWGDAENPKRMLVADEPFLRSLAQLRQYCGHGSPVRRRAGMTQAEAFALGNPDCKKLVHLLSASVVKSQVRTGGDGEKYGLGRLGQLYLDTRARYGERGHLGPCPGGPCLVNGRPVFVKCKVDGRYADAGDPYQPSHLNAIALRHVGKEILSQLFDASREEWCQ